MMLSKKLIKHCALLCLIVFYMIPFSSVCGTELNKENKASSKLIDKLLSIEIPNNKLMKSQNEQKISYTIDRGNGKLLQINVFDSITFKNEDLNVAIIACQYDRKATFSVKEEDFMSLYKIGKEGVPIKLYSKSFSRSDKGGFIEINLKDITGDELPELFVKYSFVSAGMRSWSREDMLYIINIEPPFNTMFKHIIRESKGNVKGEGYAKRYDIIFKDLDSDGIKEILIDSYEGTEETNLVKVNKTPIKYRLTDKKYIKFDAK